MGNKENLHKWRFCVRVWIANLEIFVSRALGDESQIL